MAIHNKHPGFDVDGIARVVQYYTEDRKTILQISQLEHCSLKTVRKILVDNNIPLTTHSDTTTLFNKKRWTDEERVRSSARQKNKPKKPIKDHLDDCIAVHGDLYDYSKVNFTIITNKVTIVCKEHGEFQQLLSNHKNGQGCPKCKKRRLIGGYNEKHFDRNPTAKHWDGLFYIVQLSNDHETFIKCGITAQRVLSTRLSGQLGGYSYKVIKTEQLPLYEAYLKEQAFIKNNESLRYTPMIRFDGWTECFDVSIIENSVVI